MYYLHLQGQRITRAGELYSLILKVEAIHSLKTSVNFWTKLSNVPEDSSL
jgi:hypothetical protein